MGDGQNFCYSSLVKEGVKYTVNDSVFTNLFQDKKYLLQLYQALHPEDEAATEKDLDSVTIRNVLVDKDYNDLGFMVRDKLLILVEAQSTWSENIVVRVLMYLLESYREYFQEHKVNLYGSRKVLLPKPELYVIYTGERASKPESLILSELFFGGEENALEVKVKVIYDGEQGDIINQYVTFAKIYREQLRLYERKEEAIVETIRICKDRNVLKEYLSSREKEVSYIMNILFDDKFILEAYVLDERRDAAEEAVRETTRKVTKEVTKEVTKMAIRGMIKAGKMSMEEIADCFDGLTVADIRKIRVEMGM